MPFVRVQPGDADAIRALTDLFNAARTVDDPDSPPAIAELVAADVEFGWDMHPATHYLYNSAEDADPIGALAVDMPIYDNRQVVWAEITVHPDHRRRGHGTVIMNEVLRLAKEAGRTIIWVGTGSDDPGAIAFTEKFGFRYASHDARRRQQLTDVDQEEVGRLYDEARDAAREYRLERLTPPIPDEVLAELIEVTAAINDAPTGDLTWEEEVFNLERLRDIETARLKRGDSMYRVVARHKETGEAGGHTWVFWNPLQPTLGGQGDTAVARTHRGHRLGLLLKIDMMRWLADEQPQLEIIETWNNADNTHMIKVNEAIGYRLSRVFNMYELKLEGAPPTQSGDRATQPAAAS